MAVLITGGAGYIGTHTVVELLQGGQDIVVLDNFYNSSPIALQRVETITGKSVTLVEGDVRDRGLLSVIFQEHDIDSVIHFAGLKAVGESVAFPLSYDNNVYGTLVLCETMAEAGIFNLVFSSSATVYGDPEHLPMTEDFPVGGTTNAYGTSKYMVERVLQDVHRADSRWNIALLRYFNPVGAHESGFIGEDPNGIPNNLMPFISQVAVGKRDKLSVFGDDYNTHDGTGVRDYIHVVDLALGHLCALKKLQTNPGVVIYNLGTGKGTSVLDMVRAFEESSGQKVAYEICPRRPGDIATCYADPAKARKELGWEARRGLAEMTRDTWRWQSQNPNGYAERS